MNEDIPGQADFKCQEHDSFEESCMECRWSKFVNKPLHITAESLTYCLPNRETMEAWVALGIQFFGYSDCTFIAWQDMDNAPKDGTEILAYWEDEGAHEIIAYHEGDWCDIHGHPISRMPDMWRKLDRPVGCMRNKAEGK